MNCRRIRKVLESLGESQRDADFTAPVEFAAIREHLLSALADTDSGVGFLAGSATFCALKPMRSIPFKVICLLGMNDTAFPRHAAPPAFDLAAAQPRAGDRNLRDDDRHLFLETLLSARETLYISYTGLSNRDNKESPPCAPVGELLDYLDTRFPPTEGARRNILVKKHRLQAFSSAYFQSGGPLFSYSRENWRACEQARAPRQAPPIFARTPLPDPEPEWLELDWESLAKFFANPSRHFAQKRLDLRLPEDAVPFEDCEPQTLDRLVRYGFEERLTREAIAAGQLPPGALPIARATGSLPPGYPGDSEFNDAPPRTPATSPTEFCAQVQGKPLPPISIDLTFGDWRLTGVLRDAYPAALLRHRAADVKARHLLNAWIAHLVLQCAAPTLASRAKRCSSAETKPSSFRPLARIPGRPSKISLSFMRRRSAQPAAILPPVLLRLCAAHAQEPSNRAKSGSTGSCAREMARQRIHRPGVR